MIMSEMADCSDHRHHPPPAHSRLSISDYGIIDIFRHSLYWLFYPPTTVPAYIILYIYRILRLKCFHASL